MSPDRYALQIQLSLKKEHSRCNWKEHVSIRINLCFKEKKGGERKHLLWKMRISSHLFHDACFWAFLLLLSLILPFGQFLIPWSTLNLFLLKCTIQDNVQWFCFLETLVSVFEFHVCCLLYVALGKLIFLSEPWLSVITHSVV